MKPAIKSIRAFIGSKDFEQSRLFYKELGFEEATISGNMSYFNISHNIGFYLQDYYLVDWVNNTMLFLEVEDADTYFTHLQSLQLPDKFPGVKVSPVKSEEWGKECFLHDPAGVLWHIGQFYD